MWNESRLQENYKFMHIFFLVQIYEVLKKYLSFFYTHVKVVVVIWTKPFWCTALVRTGLDKQIIYLHRLCFFRMYAPHVRVSICMESCLSFE